MSVTRRAPRSRPRRHHARPGSRPPYDAAGRLWVAILVTVLIAAGGAAWGAHGARQASRAQSHVAALQAQLAVLQRRVAHDERAVAAQSRALRRVDAHANGVQRSLQHINWTLQSVPSESQVAGVRNALGAYAACIPQLQREIDGLGLTWKIDAAKPGSDYFKLSTGPPISAACAAALAGR